MVDDSLFMDEMRGLKDELERIATALEQIVLNMEKPIRTRQDYRDEMETLG